MAHPMNSNPFPAAFVNCKGSLRVLPVSLPGNQAFIQWRIDLLTEQQHVAHMDKAINDIMVVGLTSESFFLGPMGMCYSFVYGNKLMLHPADSAYTT